MAALIRSSPTTGAPSTTASMTNLGYGARPQAEAASRLCDRQATSKLLGTLGGDGERTLPVGRRCRTTSTIEFYSFATRRITPVLSLEKKPSPWQPALSASRDGRTVSTLRPIPERYQDGGKLSMNFFARSVTSIRTNPYTGNRTSV